MLVLFNTLRLTHAAHSFSYYHSMMLSYCGLLFFLSEKPRGKKLVPRGVYLCGPTTDQQIQPNRIQLISILSYFRRRRKNPTKCLHGTVTNEINVNASLFDSIREKKIEKSFFSHHSCCVHEYTSNKKKEERAANDGDESMGKETNCVCK